MGESGGSENPRRKEVEEFLVELEGLTNNLLKKQGMVSNVVNKGINEYEMEIQKIDNYYSQFYEVIDEHKRRVLQEMKLEYDTSSHGIAQSGSVLKEAVAQSNSMKEDINASLNTIILEAEES